MNHVTIYADGGCSNNQDQCNNIGGWAVRYEYNGNIKEIYGSVANTTNNIMEITAVIEALRGMKSKSTPIQLISDSRYVVEGINVWINTWIAKGWRKANGKTPENVELWEELYNLSKTFDDITFIHCKGHMKSGPYANGNNRVDKLAQRAMKEHKC